MEKKWPFTGRMKGSTRFIRQFARTWDAWFTGIRLKKAGTAHAMVVALTAVGKLLKGLPLKIWKRCKDLGGNCLVSNQGGF
jgi:hypothetical protein